LNEILGKEVFIRGMPTEIEEKHMIKFFKKNGIAVESVELAHGKLANGKS